MSEILEAIFQRRAIRVLDPIEIPEAVRGRILDAARVAPSSFNVQPYRFYWVQSPEMKTRAAQLCMGQSPAETASALIVAVADIGSILRVLHFWKIIGSVPVARQGLFKWATKSTSLACENLMIAAEALGLNTCPMEGFDGRRLGKFLGLSSQFHEIVMVIAIGKKSARHVDQPQWRRPLEATVKFL